MTKGYTSHERFSLKNHPEFTEKWVQDLIADDLGILGLGDLVMRDRERVQPRAGRLGPSPSGSLLRIDRAGD